MIIRWDNNDSDMVSKEEAGIKLTALVADQFRRMVREIRKQKMIGAEEVVDLLEKETARVLGLPHSQTRGGLPDQGWVITFQAAPETPDSTNGKHLFLVDRSRVATTWWTEDLDEALIYIHRAAAVKRLASLHRHAPRIVPLAEARELDRHNESLYLGELPAAV